MPGEALKDAIRAETFRVLVARGRGRANVMTNEQLAAGVRERLGDRVASLSDRTLVRRVEEGVLEMLKREEAICSFSSPPRGVCIAETVEEMVESLAEDRRRALRTLRRLHWSKRALARLRGQADLRGTT